MRDQSVRQILASVIAVLTVTHASSLNSLGSGPEPDRDEPLLQIQAKAVLQGHTAGIWSVAISPDGKLLASGGGMLSARILGAKPGEIMLWDIAQEKRLATLATTRGRVHCVSFSPDGKQLATGQESILTQRGEQPGTVTLWNVKTKRSNGVYEGFQHPLFVAFLNNGNTLMLAGHAAQSRRGIQFLDIATSQKRLEIVDAGIPELSTDGKRFAFGKTIFFKTGEGLRICDTTTGQDVVNLQESPGEVKRAAFSPDGKLLVTIGPYDGLSETHPTYVWNAQTGQRIRQLTPVEATSHESIAFSMDSRLLAISGGWADEQAEITLWDVQTGSRFAVCVGHTNSISSISFSPDGKTMASGSIDKTIRIWTVPAAP